jgi:hypothetical protein
MLSSTNRSKTEEEIADQAKKKGCLLDQIQLVRTQGLNLKKTTTNAHKDNEKKIDNDIMSKVANLRKSVADDEEDDEDDEFSVVVNNNTKSAPVIAKTPELSPAQKWEAKKATQSQDVDTNVPPPIATFFEKMATKVTKVVKTIAAVGSNALEQIKNGGQKFLNKVSETLEKGGEKSPVPTGSFFTKVMNNSFDDTDDNEVGTTGDNTNNNDEW